MTELLLAEELFLLAHDEQTGRQDRPMTASVGYSGAMLLDLTEHGLLTIDDGKVHVFEAATAPHPLLDEARAVIAASEKPRKVDHWVNKLSTELKKLDERVGRSLVDRGVLDEQHGKRLGIIPTTTWPERDPQPERALREQLRRVLVDSAEPTPRLALLISLLHALDVVPVVVEKDERKDAKKRAKQISDQTATATDMSAAVAKSIQAVQAAIIAAIMVPIIAGGSS